jgi:hypothetical protein
MRKSRVRLSVELDYFYPFGNLAVEGRGLSEVPFFLQLADVLKGAFKVVRKHSRYPVAHMVSAF